jgi:hypothetical protein
VELVRGAPSRSSAPLDGLTLAGIVCGCALLTDVLPCRLDANDI